MITKRILICCSNRSEYGLLRKLAIELSEIDDTNITISVSLLFYSDSTRNCIDIAQSEFITERVDIKVLKNSTPSPKETIPDHFHKLVGIFTEFNLEMFDSIIVVGDRYETYALTSVSFLKKIPIIHLFGGDFSCGGHFDDHLRHAITCLASVHFPVNKIAMQNILAMGQESTRVFFVGSPVVDDMETVLNTQSQDQQWDILLSFNPMTLDSSNSVANNLTTTLEALDNLARELTFTCLATRPNHEPGAELINRIYDEYACCRWLTIVDSLGSPRYLYAIKNAQIVIGNSSSQLLEAPVLRTHSLLVGNRQKGRYSPISVHHMPDLPDQKSLQKTIKSLFLAPKPAACYDYGQGRISAKIAKIILEVIRFDKNFLAAKNEPLHIEELPVSNIQ